jgi:IclR family pca regulon transcriptional regulator
VSEALEESSSIALLDGDEILYVARSSTTRRIMSVDLSIGTRLPAYCTSMGRVLLAHLAPGDLDGYFERVPLVAHTPRTLITPERVRKALAAAHGDGYAVVDQELELGLRSIAVPVRDLSGRVVAAMNISTQASRVPAAELARRFLPELTAAAQELSLLLR